MQRCARQDDCDRLPAGRAQRLVPRPPSALSSLRKVRLFKVAMPRADGRDIVRRTPCPDRRPVAKKRPQADRLLGGFRPVALDTPLGTPNKCSHTASTHKCKQGQPIIGDPVTWTSQCCLAPVWHAACSVRGQRLEGARNMDTLALTAPEQ